MFWVIDAESYLCLSLEQKVHAVATVGRVVDVVPGKREEGCHLPKDVRRVVHVHVTKDADLSHCILVTAVESNRGMGRCVSHSGDRQGRWEVDESVNLGGCGGGDGRVDGI